MNLLVPPLWPLWCACALLLIAAGVNAKTLAAPNWLSLPVLLAGWLVAIIVSASPAVPSHGGGLASSLAATAVALVLLVPFYRSGWLGAGCIKMQMAFGAWVGCALSLPAAVLVTALTTLVGGLLTAFGATLAVLRMRSQPGTDAWTCLLPAQVTLSLGSVGGVIIASWIEWI